MHEEPHLFFAQAPDLVSSDNSHYVLVASTEGAKNNSHLWFLDSGCSNHMTGSKGIFTSLDEAFKLEVNLGDKKKLNVEGKGTVRISMKDDRYKLLDDVYYAPRLLYNLLSVGQLMKKGYSLVFEDGKCTIRNKATGTNLMAIKVSNNNMFLLDASQDSGGEEADQGIKTANKASQLWHLRYGHLNYQGLKHLAEKNMVRGLLSISMADTCEGCILGKHRKRPFNSSSWRATSKLGLVPHTPEHNGVVERKNITVMGLTRSMLKQKELPNHFWAEGVATAVYLLNRAPTKAVPNKTPLEGWEGLKPTVHHLKVFGCIAYSLIHPHNRQKLDHRSEKCLFVGYSQESCGYRLYNPSSKKFTVQKHVIFDEEGVWKWNSEGTKEPILNPTRFSDPFPFTHLDPDNSQTTTTGTTLATSPTQIILNTSTLTPLPTLPRPLQNPNQHNPSTSTPQPNEGIIGPAKRISKPPT
ncbi:hypothetical protein E3N88_14732 [Mikania micrantha]|uniref:Integrase catalytic domain-containing protein n=1 Tax=Mikania micrantha TaxID=192012 RepID=A0A5N6P2I6_9ASTR|nr:hypothetical protein E3N88_14732 [Mikania micrantha]